jgi:spermidine/putrescine transport system substrate-binding protein
MSTGAVRRFTRRSLLAASASLALPAPRGANAADPVLQMLCWEGFDDPAATAGFALATQRVGANDEFFTFLRAGGPGRFDLITPSDGVVQALARAGLIQPIDLARLANYGNLFPRFQSPAWSMLDGAVYALPISWRTSPLIFNSAALSTPPAAWTDLAGEAFDGRVAMTDDVLSNLIVWNRALGASDPVRVTRAFLDDSIAELSNIKRNRAVAFVNSPVELAAELASGRSWASTAGQENVPAIAPPGTALLQLAHPAPGDFSVCDSLCLAAGSQNVETAYAFLDHMISNDAQAALARRLYRGTVSATTVEILDLTVRSLYEYEELDAVFATSPLAGFPPLEADAGEIATYVDWVVAWDRVRFAPLKSR